MSVEIDGNFVKVDGKVVGELINNRKTYLTPRNSTKHFYRKAQGYPISVNVLELLKIHGVKDIVVLETRKDGTRKKYRVFVSDYNNVEIFKEPDYDFQKCIPLRRMETIA